MIVFPNCKINLGLFVTGKRADGFHSIESVFLPVPLTDILEVIPNESAGCEFRSDGLSVPGDPQHNIIVKAWELMRSRFNIGGVSVHLYKHIPMGAGLGGGSADGAFMLRALNEMFAIGLSETSLEELAGNLGSDCPFFIRNRPAFVSGRGEVLEWLSKPLFNGWIALINPGVHVGTAEAYSLITPRPAPFNLRELHQLPFSEWKNCVTNDFEAPISEAHLPICAAHQKLKESGAGYCAMSGSGSTVYGLYTEKPVIEHAQVYPVKW